MLAFKDSLTKRQRLEILRSQLENERSSFISHWRDLADYILPRRAEFQLSDNNRGEKKNQKIIDNTATLAARTLASGMMSGVTSPARPWFRLTTPDPELAEYGPVKEWLHIVASRMATSFLRSNLYNTLPTLYKDVGVFGTAPIIVEEDFRDVFRTQSFPVGSYMVAKDYRGVVNVFMREFRMTVRQLLEMFGKRDPITGKPVWDNFSTYVRDLYDNGNMEAWIDVVHAIYPNEDYVPQSGNNKQKKFSSCYYERGTSGQCGSGRHISSEDNTFLRESGYDYFPVLCPRWEVTGQGVYGNNCPGMEALGDIKQLQLGEKRIMQAVDKMINPPMVGPSVLRTQKASILPGDITFVDVREGTGGFRPAHEVNFRIQEMEQKQAQVRERINDAFFVNLLLMLANTDRRQITATEIEARNEEKLLALGPVLEQLNQDLLDPLIDITFDFHLKNGLIPPPPEELQGENLKVEYISIMAQAQKLISIGAVERFTGFVGNMAGVVPSVLQKINSDQLVDVMADILSVPPSLVKTDEEVAKIRQAEAQAAQQQQQAMMMQQGAATAKDLSQIPMEEDSALTELLNQANAGSLVA